jgi:enoyl-[acyl-carrier-protein] reductase (NADH)
VSFNSTQPLDGRIALVTGAGRARGIGRGIALALAEAGADMVVTDVGARADLHVEGVGLGELGIVDVLANNAGTGVGVGPFLGLA